MSKPSGDETVAQLFETHAAALLLYARQWVGDAEAHDVIQRVFVVQEYAEASDGLWKVLGLQFPRAQEEMMAVWRKIAPQQPPALENPLIQTDLVRYPPEYRYPAVLYLRYNFERSG
jgi:hypothetical protein